jgi:hypothetical protein
MIQRWSHNLARAIDAVRINALTRATYEGRPVWVKRRRVGMDGVIACGQVFLNWTGSGITMFASVSRWQQQEIRSFRLLHAGEGYTAGRFGCRGVWQSELAGTPLRTHAIRGTLTLDMLAAAGRALCAAHQLACPHFRGGWSHGDPHLGNLLYDASDDRVRLIDFETRHSEVLDDAWRHGDDLLTVVLELAGRASPAAWPATVDAFLSGYGLGEAMRTLERRLKRRQPFEHLLWVSRASGADRARIDRMLACCRSLYRSRLT